MLKLAGKKLWLICTYIACMATGVLFAQTPPNLPTGSTFVRVPTFTDYLIPNNIQSLYIRARGGNGGITTHGLCTYLGGEAARIEATFLIGNVACPNPNSSTLYLRPGGTLRFICGKNGRNANTDDNTFGSVLGGGGGGSAVLYRPPGSSSWTVLLVAGGGGGAFATYRAPIGNIPACTGASAFNASLSEGGTNGGGGNPGGGGINGNGGAAGGIIAGDGGGGGGMNSSGGSGDRSGVGGGSGGTEGGLGGTVNIRGTVVRSGGYGFGAGGGGAIAGGGGGGYSGGGGGSANGMGTGGGGGSFVIRGALNVTRMNQRTDPLGGDFNLMASVGPPATSGVTRLFVRAAATGQNNGTSWANAFTRLQDALTAANALCAAEIWVAAGTYYPDEGTGLTDNNRNHAFEIKNGVALYGGFAGNETQLSQRNWRTNATILSGDLQKNDGNYQSASFTNYADNAFNVVITRQTNNSAILDGFEIVQGNANGGGQLNNGGGLHSIGSSMVVSNCTIAYNTASAGGGMLLQNALHVFSNCIFKSNLSSSSAGAVYITTSSVPFFYNCIFQANVVRTSGSAQGLGGAIVTQANSNPEFINCTFSGNVASFGGVFYNFQNSRPRIFNSVMWASLSANNTANANTSVVSDNTSGISYQHCLVQHLNLAGSNGNLDGTNGQNNPLFTLADNPQLSPASNGILTLARCSPLVNRGNNGFLANSTDLAGNPRFVDGTVDIGAYEVQQTGSIFYVNAAATGSNNGTSWANAFVSLQSALQQADGVCGIQIWVARGIYLPATGSDRNVAFSMKNNTAIFGGFAGFETSALQRNWRLNPTILSGDIGIQGNRSDNAHNVVSNINNNLNATAILDGFIIRDGQADKPEYVRQRGAGMFNLNSSPLVRNCIFTNNRATAYGGAVFNEGAAATPTFVNCVFSGNQAEFGGGVYNESAQTRIINCTFSSNVVSGTGGGMYSFGLPQATMVNSIVWGNTNGVNNASSNTTPIQVTHSIVQEDYIGNANLNSDPLFSNQAPVGLGQLGDLRLLVCSPGANSGNNTALPAGTATDIAANNRIFQTTVDRGAYERQTSPVGVDIYVDATATNGTNEGTSWANAFTTMQAALNDMNLCSGGSPLVVHIAAGTYIFPVGRQAVVDNLNGRILGGYPAGGGTRNAAANPVIIRGNIQVLKNVTIDGVRVE